MPKPMVILTWPQSVRDALNERLRATTYSSVKRTVEWLAQTGYDTSASTLQVYATRLREFDAENGVETACMLLRKPLPPRGTDAPEDGRRLSRLVVASAELEAVAKSIDDIAARLNPVDGTLMRRLSARLRAVAKSLQSTSDSRDASASAICNGQA